MKKEFKWGNLIIVVLLLALAALVYVAQVMIFQNPRQTIYYIFQDTAFLPLHVLLVTFVLDQLINRREKNKKLKQINIIRSAFFNEAGTPLIESMLKFSTNLDTLKAQVKQTDYWTHEQDINLETVKKFEHVIDSKKSDLIALKNEFMAKKEYVLNIIQNQNLLEEHDAFTDMLWALYHVMDELNNREETQILILPQHDLDHLSRDFERAFKLLIMEWAIYMKHLKKEYPYLFSLALRKNPFAEQQVIFQ